MEGRELLQVSFVDDGTVSRKQASDIFSQFFQSVGFGLNRMDLQIVLFCQLEKVRSFTAKTCATVKVSRPRTKRSKQAGGQLGCLVLYLEKTFRIAWYRSN